MVLFFAAGSDRFQIFEVSVSIVIVGRNAADQLCRIYSKNRSSLAFADEILYIDSASEDESVSIAQGFGWRVFQLDPAGVLSAAAGRHGGAPGRPGGRV